MKRRPLVKSLVAALGLGAAVMATGLPIAQAQSYPTKPVRLVVPFPPGGATDVIGRIMAVELSTALGQQVIVDNRAGASGNIGADQVAKAPKDGYTLLMGALTSHSINATLEKSKLQYNLEKDLTAVSIVGVVPLVFVVNPSVPAKNLKEFIAYAKANPQKLTYASSGAGAPQRMAMEMFKRANGIEVLHVPYKGSGPAMTDLVGGQVLSMAETVPAALPFIQQGKLRPLAVSTAKRVEQLGDVPTVMEVTGLKDFDVVSMFGIVAPTGTPKPVIDRLNVEIEKILKRQDVKDKMLAAGVYVNYLNAADAQKKISREISMWAKVITEGNIKTD